MKGIFLFSAICLVVLLSCSPSKRLAFENPILFYLNRSEKDIGKEIIILDKKISNKKTLSIFKGTLLFNPVTNTYGKDGKRSQLYNDNDWVKMNAIYSNDTIISHWKIHDFERRKVVIEDYNLYNENLLYEKFKEKENYKVYAFSDPILYKNEYIMFTVLETDTSISRLIKEYILIMKKDKNGWNLIEKIYSDDIYN